MSIITRTNKASIDTDEDQEDDVILSVVPTEPQKFLHSQKATYKVQLENKREVAVGVFKKVQDIYGNEEYERILVSIEPGSRITIDPVLVGHDEKHNPGIPTLTVRVHVAYRIAIGAKRFPVEFDIEADCQLEQ